MRAAFLVALFAFDCLGAEPHQASTEHAEVASSWPVAVSLEKVSVGARRWSYSVKITIVNTLKRPLALDGPSVGESGSLQNDLFEVFADGKRVEYSGVMAKRAPPDSFLTIAPGQSYSKVLELSECYPVPAGTNEVTVAFSHTNHFSPDAFELRSKEPLRIVPHK